MVSDRSADAPTAESFTALYRTWRDFVKREAYFVCRSDADADDVVQIVFLRVWDSTSWSEIRHPRSCFRGAARLEAVRIVQRLSHFSDEFEIVDPAKGPFRRAVAGKARAILEDASDTLPARCREVMVLTVLEGCSAAEVGGRMRSDGRRGGQAACERLAAHTGMVRGPWRGPDLAVHFSGRGG